MRKTVVSILKDAAPEVLSWHQQGSLDEAPPRPFGTYRLRGSAPGIKSSHVSKAVGLEVWVHDDQGSYLRIDATLTLVESAFKNLMHASAAAGESISQATYESRSPDLNDDGLRTICRMSSFTLIGKGQ